MLTCSVACAFAVSVSISRTPSGDANLEIRRAPSDGSSRQWGGGDVAIHLDHDHKADKLAVSHGGSHHSDSQHGSSRIKPLHKDEKRPSISRSLGPVQNEEGSKGSKKASYSGLFKGSLPSSPGSPKEVSWDEVSEKLGKGAAKSDVVKDVISHGGHTSWPATDDKDASATPMRGIASPRTSLEAPQVSHTIGKMSRVALVSSKTSRVSISELMNEQAKQKEEFDAWMKSKAASKGKKKSQV